MDETKPLFPRMINFMGILFMCIMVSTALHEGGHALMVWLTGNEFSRITLSPFSWSYTYYNYTEEGILYKNWITWAGSVTEVLIGLVIMVWGMRNPRKWLAPVYMLGFTSLAAGGLYYFIDPLFKAGGDASKLISRGIPTWSIYGFAAIAVLLAVIAAMRFIPLMGLGWEMPPKEWLVILLGGITPYAVCIVVYSQLYTPDETPRKLFTSGILIMLVIIFSFLPKKWLLKFPWAKDQPVQYPTTRAAWISVVIALAIILTEFAIWGVA